MSTLGGIGGGQIAVTQNGTIYINTVSSASTSSVITHNTYTSSSATGTNLLFAPATVQNLHRLSDPEEVWKLLFETYDGRRLKAPKNTAFEMEMADGSVLKVDALGNYKITNPAKKIVYQASSVRAFNRYLNASDLIAKFVAYLDSLQIKKADVLGLPMELFIHWLVIESAKADGEVLPDGDEKKFAHLLKDRIQLNPQIPNGAKPLALPAPPKRPRCGCGRFLSGQRHRHGLLFCSGAHMDRYESVLLGRPLSSR